MQRYSTARARSEDVQEMYFTVYPDFTNVDEFMEKYNTDRKFHRVFLRWAYFWENLGGLIKLGYVPIEFAAVSAGQARTIIDAWERFRDIIYRFRESGQRSKRDFDMWEYLYDSLIQYFEEHPELAP